MRRAKRESKLHALADDDASWREGRHCSDAAAQGWSALGAAGACPVWPEARRVLVPPIAGAQAALTCGRGGAASMLSEWSDSSCSVLLKGSAACSRASTCTRTRGHSAHLTTAQGPGGGTGVATSNNGYSFPAGCTNIPFARRCASRTDQVAARASGGPRARSAARRVASCSGTCRAPHCRRRVVGSTPKEWSTTGSRGAGGDRTSSSARGWCSAVKPRDPVGGCSSAQLCGRRQRLGAARRVATAGTG